MTIEVLDPTFDESPAGFEMAPRLAGVDALRGATVGVVSNAKHGTAGFFESFADELRSQFGVADVMILCKANYSAPAGDELMAEAQRWQALIAGIGD